MPLGTSAVLPAQYSIQIQFQIQNEGRPLGEDPTSRYIEFNNFLSLYMFKLLRLDVFECSRQIFMLAQMPLVLIMTNQDEVMNDLRMSI